MIARYRLVLNVPHWHRAALDCVDVGSFRTVERALRRADAVLAAHPDVTAHGAAPKATFSCSLYDAKAPRGAKRRGVLVKLTDAQRERLEAPVFYVPSVGDRGCW
jgi:hypothetical protein